MVTEVAFEVVQI